MNAVLRIKKSHVPSVAGGCPWVMRHMAVESSEWLAAEPGCLAQVESERGEFIGVGVVNPLSQIVCRLLSWKKETINQTFFEQKIAHAFAKRNALFNVPCYRLVHAEADYLPGLVMDRFGDLYVIQVGSAGMEKLQPLWLAALEKLLQPATILLKNDFGARKLEGLSQGIQYIKGEVPKKIKLIENDCLYFADVLHGQKTGWFYDMRDNRKMLANLAKDKTVIDVFSHSGGFGLLTAKQGAAQVTMVDSSELALGLAMDAAVENGVAEHCQTLKGDAGAVMQGLAAESKRYDIVIADPPAYVKSKKDIGAGLKGYEKIAAYAASLVAPGGVLFTATCSHHAGRGAFNKAVFAGVASVGRQAEIVKQTGASADHPIHPHLPQSEYLKGLLLRLS